MIIITGRPCTGKTTLGRKLSRELHLSFISRDDLKECLFDSLGWKDRAWSRKLGGASYHVLYQFVESLLAAGHSLIVESNFNPESDTSRFLDLNRKYGFNPVQIHCRTDSEVLFERFKARSESGERHPGHVDHLTYQEFRDSLGENQHESLDIGGTVLEVDTTDLGSIEIESLLQVIRGLVPQRSQWCRGNERHEATAPGSPWRPP